MNKITNIKINRPSQNEMEKYIAVWNNFKNRKENKISKYYFQEIAIKKIFDHYWKNTISNVLIKVCCLNIFYSTKIFDIYHICKGIAKIGKKLETKLRNGDLGVIEEIANVSKKYSDKGRRNYSFATKFCCLHNKNKFPIFDRAVWKLIYDLQKKYKFSKKKFIKNDLKKNYKLYKEVIDDFISFFHLHPKDYRELDKYLWVAAGTPFK